MPGLGFCSSGDTWNGAVIHSNASRLAASHWQSRSAAGQASPGWMAPTRAASCVVQLRHRKNQIVRQYWRNEDAPRVGSARRQAGRPWAGGLSWRRPPLTPPPRRNGRAALPWLGRWDHGHASRDAEAQLDEATREDSAEEVLHVARCMCKGEKQKRRAAKTRARQQRVAGVCGCCHCCVYVGGGGGSAVGAKNVPGRESKMLRGGYVGARASQARQQPNRPVERRGPTQFVWRHACRPHTESRRPSRLGPGS